MERVTVIEPAFSVGEADCVFYQCSAIFLVTVDLCVAIVSRSESLAPWWQRENVPLSEMACTYGWE